jgi:hypothetical protein
MKKLTLHSERQSGFEGYLYSSTPWAFAPCGSTTSDSNCLMKIISEEESLKKNEYLVENLSVTKDTDSEATLLHISMEISHAILEVSFISNSRFVEVYGSDSMVLGNDYQSTKYLGTSKGSEIPLPNSGMHKKFTHEYSFPEKNPLKFIHFKCLSLKPLADPAISLEFLHFRLLIDLSRELSQHPKSGEVSNSITGLSMEIIAGKMNEFEQLKKTVNQIRSEFAPKNHLPQQDTPSSQPQPLLPSSKTSDRQPATVNLSLEMQINQMMNRMQEKLLADIHRVLDQKLAPVLERMTLMEEKLISMQKNTLRKCDEDVKDTVGTVEVS